MVGVFEFTSRDRRAVGKLRALIRRCAGCAKGGNPIRLTRAIGDVEQRRFRGIVTGRVKVRALPIELEKWRMAAPAHSVVKRESPAYFPLILGIPLQQPYFTV